MGPHDPDLNSATARIAEQNRHFRQLRVAIVHYWFLSRGGGESVIEAMAQIFPQADIYTLLADDSEMPTSLRAHHVTTSFLQKIPWCKRLHRKLLPLYPIALEQFDLNEYDLVISSESGPAKGVLTSPHCHHICYCHTPMRYLWDLYHEYCGSADPLARFAFVPAAHYLRMWDLASSFRVDRFAANCANVAGRIRKHYRRDATVIFPPVSVTAERACSAVQDYYLIAGRLVDYKRVDLAIKACNLLKRPLRIIGTGPEYKRLKRLADSSVEFLGYLPREEFERQLASCRALLFPGEEDFGIVPVEANALGRPVIAYGMGGVLETVNGLWPARQEGKNEPTGIFFSEQTVESLSHAILKYEAENERFLPESCIRSGARFSFARFCSDFADLVNLTLGNETNGPKRAVAVGESTVGV